MVFEVDNDTVHIFVQHTHMHTVYTYVYIGKEKYTVYICSGHWDKQYIACVTLCAIDHSLK